MGVAVLWKPLFIMALVSTTTANSFHSIESDDAGVAIIDIVDRNTEVASFDSAYLRGVTKLEGLAMTNEAADLAVSLSFHCSESHIIRSTDTVRSMTCTIDEGSFTYYYNYDDDSNASEHDVLGDYANCQTILVLGVGAAMSSTEYSQLAIDIVTEDSSILTVVVDDNPHEIKKQSNEKYAAIVHTVVTNIDTYIPICASNLAGLPTAEKQGIVQHQDRTIIIGGHSASGEAAFHALPLFFDPSSSYFLPIGIQGFIGLAPYKIEAPTIQSTNGDKTKTLKGAENASLFPIPSLYWGFSTKSCAVDVDYAADMAYKLSNPKYRVLYQVQTSNDKFNPMTGGPHCVFSDNGCMKLCNPSNMQWVKNSVATTIATFIVAIKESGGGENGGFSRETFAKVLPSNTKLFVNDDQLMHDGESWSMFKAGYAAV